MIGVIADPAEHTIVCEFFELFKTPWEFYQSDRKYEVVVCPSDDNLKDVATKVILIYSGRKLPIDTEKAIEIGSRGKRPFTLSYNALQIPIYGDSITFREEGGAVVDQGSHSLAVHVRQSGERVVARIGYDLFGEIRLLLTAGQPSGNAAVPTLDLHIALLRDLIVGSGISLVEIPPVPAGFQFIACLTHDIDHPSLRRHKFDHTMFGFLYRAILGSLFEVLRGRRSLRSLLTNWAAALKLPLVHLGLAKDFWHVFDDYAKLEGGLRSSFFLIPFKGRPGRMEHGSAPGRRAAPYGASEIAGHLRKLISTGCEFGLHGIDAWVDTPSGREELEEIRQITGKQNIGVRMHWLYFDQESPVKLEKAGVDYDATVGFNETIGYRAGTSQVYKPLAATRLLELPLHIMDTALFFPTYLDLSPREPSKRVDRIIDHAVQHGGTVTVNWHDRSIVPERLWGDFYVNLVNELKNRGAWFSTGLQAVSWFRKRRSAVFETVSNDSGTLRVTIGLNGNDDLPGLRLRIHRPGGAVQDTGISAFGPNQTLELRLENPISTCEL